ncbi:MAG: peptidylprolyl isomerase [Candidatus Woesearchaeota archaeon]|jgi:peptidylprolyl isomerase
MAKKETTIKDNTTVKSGDKVSVHYTGKLKDGSVFDSSEGRAPLTFAIGAGQVIPGFDKAITGMKLSEKKTFTIPAAEAYGPVVKELVLEIPRNRLPPQPEPQIGMQLVMRGPQGQQVPAMITKVEGDKVTIDINHPLAGKDLTFEIEVVGINDPNVKDEEEGCCCGDEECGSCADDECGCEEDKKECSCDHKHKK